MRAAVTIGPRAGVMPWPGWAEVASTGLLVCLLFGLWGGLTHQPLWAPILLGLVGYLRGARRQAALAVLLGLITDLLNGQLLGTSTLLLGGALVLLVRAQTGDRHRWEFEHAIFAGAVVVAYAFERTVLGWVAPGVFGRGIDIVPVLSSLVLVVGTTIVFMALKRWGERRHAQALSGLTRFSR